MQSVYQADGQDIVAICVRFPRSMYEQIRIDATRENRSYGRQVVQLCQAAMREQEASKQVNPMSRQQQVCANCTIELTGEHR